MGLTTEQQPIRKCTICKNFRSRSEFRAGVGWCKSCREKKTRQCVECFTVKPSTEFQPSGKLCFSCKDRKKGNSPRYTAPLDTPSSLDLKAVKAFCRPNPR